MNCTQSVESLELRSAVPAPLANAAVARDLARQPPLAWCVAALERSQAPF